MSERAELPLNHEPVPSTKEDLLAWCRRFIYAAVALTPTWAHEFVHLAARSVEEPDEKHDGWEKPLSRALMSEWQRRRIQEIHGDALNLVHDHCPELAERAVAVVNGHGFEEWRRSVMRAVMSPPTSVAARAAPNAKKPRCYYHPDAGVFLGTFLLPPDQRDAWRTGDQIRLANNRTTAVWTVRDIERIRSGGERLNHNANEFAKIIAAYDCAHDVS